MCVCVYIYIYLCTHTHKHEIRGKLGKWEIILICYFLYSILGDTYTTHENSQLLFSSGNESLVHFAL